MRKLLRNMTKAKMRNMGYANINKRMSRGRWREIIGAYPMNIKTGRQMKKSFYGNKKYPKCWRNPIFMY